MAKIVENVNSAAKNFVAGIRLFIIGLGHRDRYLTEFVAACVSFIAGVIASTSPDTVSSRVSMDGFTQMPMPEFWVAMVALPGLIVVTKNWWYRRLDEDHDKMPVVVMAGYLVLCLISSVLDFGNWIFWTFLFLMIGTTQWYALAREWTDLRWAVSVVGSFCWIGMTFNVLTNVAWPWPIAMAAYIGVAMCNFLTTARLASVRRHTNEVRKVAWYGGA